VCVAYLAFGQCSIGQTRLVEPRLERKEGRLDSYHPIRMQM
jgi:hypothetical protein